MAIYEHLFLFATLLWFISFILWIFSLVFPKQGVDGIYIAISYPTIILVCIAAIIGLLDQGVHLYRRFLLMGIAIVWTIGGRIIHHYVADRKRLFLQFLLQIAGLAGAIILADMYYWDFISFI